MSEEACAAAQIDEIIDLDSEGDGVTKINGRRVPLALPGDRVRFCDGGPRIEPLSPHRTTPCCPLFGQCGGCRVQHLADDYYSAWKVGCLTSALAAAGLTPPVAPMARAPFASRRRMTLTAQRRGKSVAVGYYARASHEVIDVAACPALDPRLAQALPALRETVRQAAQATGEARLVATLCDNGVDAALTRAAQRRDRHNRRNKPKRRVNLTLPAAPSIIRISDDGETLIAADTPFVRFDTVSVAFPAGAFLQPSLAGEKALTQLVTAGVGEASTVLDAFCGLGTFALPLSRHGAVTAVDQNGPAMDALDEAARMLTGRRPITTKRRDLMRDPLSPAELNAFDGVVFDPPRAGAKAFAAALAASKVPQVVAVSCEPKTLARDCATLVAGGYKIAHVVPVDQFVATSHLETVVVLRRDP